MPSGVVFPGRPYRDFRTAGCPAARISWAWGGLTVSRSEVIFLPTQPFLIKTELPEVGSQDLDIRVANNTLTIRGERKLDKNPERIEDCRTRSFGPMDSPEGIPPKLA